MGCYYLTNGDRAVLQNARHSRDCLHNSMNTLNSSELSRI